MCVCLLCVIVSLIVLGVCIFACFLLSIDRGLFNFFFFLKKKRAYERRISDWSSDVCSSDLAAADVQKPGPQGAPQRPRVLHLRDRLLDGPAADLCLGLPRGAGGAAQELGDQVSQFASIVAACLLFAVPAASAAPRSVESRVGKEWVSRCRSRWASLN